MARDPDNKCKSRQVIYSNLQFEFGCIFPNDNKVANTLQNNYIIVIYPVYKILDKVCIGLISVVCELVIRFFLYSTCLKYLLAVTSLACIHQCALVCHRWTAEALLEVAAAERLQQCGGGWRRKTPFGCERGRLLKGAPGRRF